MVGIPNFTLILGSNIDPATAAWVAAVIANGGSVSSTQQGYVDTLITGLKTDGIWTKLDRLWLFASENTAQALTDIVADVLATATSAPTFTANVGYTGNGSSAFINSNTNPTTLGGNYQRDSACFLVWNNTTGTENKGMGGAFAGGGTALTSIVPNVSGGIANYSINFNNYQNGGGGSGATGLYLVNRSASTADTIDINGAQNASSANASFGQQNTNMRALSDGNNFSAKQASCMGFGGSLTGTDRSNIYSRLRTYMTAVGVP